MPHLFKQFSRTLYLMGNVKGKHDFVSGELISFQFKQMLLLIYAL